MATTYKIGEAAALLNLKTYVLRFWETEFPDIVPLRTDKGQRLYTEENLALLERIRFLLHERGLTIEGARKALLEDKEKGLVYTFSPGMNVRPVMAEGESAASDPQVESGPEAADALEAEGGLEAEGEDASGAEGPVAAGWNAGGAGSPEGAVRLVEDEGTAVKRFLSQYNLPGISKTYPIHAPPLFERREPPLRDAPLKSASVEVSGGEEFASPPESVLSRHKGGTNAFLRELATELEAIADLLRDNNSLPDPMDIP